MAPKDPGFIGLGSLGGVFVIGNGRYFGRLLPSGWDFVGRIGAFWRSGWKFPGRSVTLPRSFFGTWVPT